RRGPDGPCGCRAVAGLACRTEGPGAALSRSDGGQLSPGRAGGVFAGRDGLGLEAPPGAQRAALTTLRHGLARDAGASTNATLPCLALPALRRSLVSLPNALGDSLLGCYNARPLAGIETMPTAFLEIIELPDEIGR